MRNILFLLCLVTGAAVQFQLGLFPGRVVFGLPEVKVGFLFFLLVHFVWNIFRNGLANVSFDFTFRLAIVFLAILVAGSLVSSVTSELVGGVDRWYLFLASYMMVMAGVFFIPRSVESNDRLGYWVMAIMIPLSIFGAYQYYINDPVLPTEDPAGKFVVGSWDFFGQVRGFSLFLSGLDFGFFISFAYSMVVVLYLKRQLGLALFFFYSFLALLAMWCASTRLTMVLMSFSVATVYVLVMFGRVKQVVYVLPLVYLLVGYVVVDILPSLLVDSLGDLVSDDSVYARLAYAADVLDLWASGGVPTVLFGTGLSQSASLPHLIVDNSFLNSLLQNGIIGLVAFAIYSWVIWVEGVRRFSWDGSFAAIAALSMYSTFMYGFMLNTIHGSYFLISIIFIRLVDSRMVSDN